MAALDTDLEKAFTNGDPEAVLDFLVIRSRQMLRSEDEEDPAGSVPQFTSDNDMAAFVRDLTIDDAIAHCFADLPSDCDDSVTSSTRGLLPSRPERKLTDPKTAAEADPIQKHPPDTSRRSATVKQQSPSSPAAVSNSVSRGNSRGKSRGFLSSLLGRGHKGRRGSAQRKPAHHYHDPSSRHSDVTFSGFSSEDDKKKVASDCEPVAHPRWYCKNVPECLSESSLLPGDLADVHGKQAGVGKQQTAKMDRQHMVSLQVQDGRVRQVTSDSDPVCVIEYCLSQSSARDVDSVEHKLETAVQPSDLSSVTNPSVQRKPPAISGFGSSNSYAHTLAKRPQGNDHQVYPHPYVPNGLSSPPKHTETSASNQPVGMAGNAPNTIHSERVLPSHTCPQAPTCLASEKNQTSAVVHSAEHTHNLHGGKDQKLAPQKPWEGICDGVDAFIDFERDPNLEVPLDSHLSVQFDFERRHSEGRFQGGEEQGQVLVNRPQVSDPPEAPHWTLQTPVVKSTEQGIRAGDQNPGTKTVLDTSTLMCASRLQHQSQNPQAKLMTPPKVSASTQTENSNLELSEGSVHPRVGHCLRTAITQLSSLSACSTCHDVITRTLADLKKALLETGSDVTRETIRISEPAVPHGQSGVPCLEKQPDNALLNKEVADQPRVESSSPICAYPTEPGSSGHGNMSQDDETDLQGHPASDLTTDHNSAVPKTSQSHSYPEPSTQPSKQSRGVGKKQMTSSRVSVDSDSASTSTVTSEPVTVLACQRGNRSSSGSSKVGRPPDKVVSAASSFSVDSAKAGASQSSEPAPPFVMDDIPGLDSNAAKTKPKAAMQPVTTVGGAPPFRAGPARPRKDARGASRYAGEADRDYESFMTSSWSEMTSVSSVSDIVTSADESSYYSGDDDDNEDEDEEEDDDLTTVVRLGLLDEDRDDNELRQHRLQRHLAAVLRQTSIPASTVETVVAATGERLNGQERPVNHVNQGSLYPFSPRPAVHGAAVGHDAVPPAFSVPAPAGPRGESCLLPPSVGLHAAASAASASREARAARKSKKGAGPRLFSPDRQVSLISARQMTSEEFREGYDRSTDIAKAKRSQLDGDIPWDLIPCSDTDDDAGSDKAWYNVTSEDDSLAHAYGSDTDSSTTVSDW